MCLRPRASARVPTLGWKPVIAIGWANAAHFYSLCSIFSYAGFLAVDCGWAADADTAGFVAGLLPTAVLFGRLFTSILWGHAADRCGRRPSMIASMVAVTLGNVCFGLTTSLPAALAVRFLLIGALNGWVTLMGLCVLECAGEAMQPVVWSYVFATGSVVALLGPAIGGWTYAALGPRFPALPPSLVGGAIGATAVAVNVAWLPETKPRAASSSASAATASSSAIRAASPAAAASSSTLRAASTSFSAAAASSSYSSREGPAGKANKADAGGGARTRLATHPGGGGEGGGEGSGGGDNGGGDNGGGGSGGARPPLSAVLCSHPLPLVMVLRAAHGCALFAAFDLVPLWCMASRYAGGLALTEEQLGTSLAAGAVVQVVFTSLAMGRLVRRLGLHASLTAGCTAAALLTLCLLASPSATAERWWLRALGASLVYGLQTSAMLLAGTALVSMSNLPRALEAESLPISPHPSPDLPIPPQISCLLPRALHALRCLLPRSSAVVSPHISPYLPISIHPQSPVLVAPSAHAVLCTHGTRGWCSRPEAGVSTLCPPTNAQPRGPRRTSTGSREGRETATAVRRQRWAPGRRMRCRPLECALAGAQVLDGV